MSKSATKIDKPAGMSTGLLSGPLILEQPNGFLSQVIPVRCEETGEDGWNVYHYSNRMGGWQFYDNVSRRTVEAMVTSEVTRVFVMHRTPS